MHDARGRFNCQCSICLKQINIEKVGRGTLHEVPGKLKVSLSVIDRNNYYKRFDSDKKDFVWLMEKLLSNSDRILGCELIFPDTVFFKEGKPSFIIKMDREFCLICIRA